MGRERLDPAAGPSGRYDHAMATINDKVVLFGGITGPGAYGVVNDTWEWDGTAWTQRMLTTSPSPRWSPGCATR
jgi:hypothetical protein